MLPPTAASLALDSPKTSAWNLLPFIAVHLGCLAAFFVEFRWTYVLLCLALYYGWMFFVTAGYPRYFSHRSFKTSRALGGWGALV